jgi:hypothetical protein
MKVIFGAIWERTNKFDDKTLQPFIRWCNKQKPDFLSVEPERKVMKAEGQKIRLRLLSVLEDKYYGNAKMPHLYEFVLKLISDHIANSVICILP